MAASKTLTNLSPPLITHWRKLAGLTIPQAAKKAKLDPATIYHWEDGSVKPSAAKFSQLAKALGKEVKDFFPVNADDLRNKATSIVDDYLSDPNYDKERKSARAIDILKIPLPELEPLDDIDVPSKLFTGWRNREMLPFTSERCIKVKTHIGKPLVAVGPTRCAKTHLMIENLISLHFANPGLRSFVARSDAVDLKDTIRNDIREISEYSLDDPLSPISAIGRGGSRNFTSLDINGGEMVLGGLNRDSRLLGTSYDVIFTSQLEQVDERSFNKMLTRCAGDAGNLKDDEGNNIGLFFADANPAPDSDHWILKYADNNKIEILNFTFEDNPLYYDRHGNQTKTGETVINQLDEGLEGIDHDLYFKAIWADLAGKLFEFDDSIHLIDEPKNLNDYLWYRGIDFGITSPNVCIWFGVHRSDKHIYVHREFRKTKIDTITFGEEINHHTNERVLSTIIDNNETEQLHLRRTGINSEMTKKSPTSVMERVHLLQNLINKSREGQEGGIYFNKSIRCNADPNLIRDKKALSVVEEIKKLSADDNDKIIGSDHGFDALTYGLLWLQEAKAAVGFGSGSARRNKRL